MDTPITTPNSRNLINEISFEGCLVDSLVPRPRLQIG